MNPILNSLLEAIDEIKTMFPKHASFPKLVGAAIALTTGEAESLSEWISMLEDANSPMHEIMAVAAKWDDSNSESIAYYVEITNQLRDGLYIAIDSVGY